MIGSNIPAASLRQKMGAALPLRGPGPAVPVHCRPLHAFTMLEVLAMLLVVSLGMLAVVGLFVHANRLAAKVEGTMTGMATAISVAHDAQPWFRDPVLAAQTGWTAPPALSDSPYQATGRGYVNGFYVIRNETSTAADILASDAGVVTARSVRVDVDVYESMGGGRVASFSTRLVRVTP